MRPSCAHVDRDTLRRLSRLRPTLTFSHIVLEFLGIAAAVILCERYFSVFTYVLAAAFIGGRQHGLVTLIHEGIHRRISHSKTVNDGLSEAMALPFLLLDFHKLRASHLAHHRHTNTERDPDLAQKQGEAWVFPQKPRALLRTLLLDLVGFGFLRVIVKGHALEHRTSAGPVVNQPARRRRAMLLRMAFLAVVVGSGFGRHYLIYWLVPFLTWLQVCIRIRSIAEHFAIFGRTDEFAQHRTTITGLLERTFVVQNNLNYHLEHHLYPTVPFFNLPQLHSLLMSRAEYANSAQISRGYLRVLRECVGHTRVETRPLVADHG